MHGILQFFLMSSHNVFYYLIGVPIFLEFMIVKISSQPFGWQKWASRFLVILTEWLAELSFPSELLTGKDVDDSVHVAVFFMNGLVSWSPVRLMYYIFYLFV